MDVTTVFYTVLFGKKVGKDEFGNTYYKRVNGGKRYSRERRWVIFSGSAEASKVPPEWEGWLRHSVENPLPKSTLGFQQMHMPNLTGTRLATKVRYKTKETYKPWNPQA